MEWLISSTEFKRRDRSYFNFNPNQVFEVLVIKVEGKENVRHKPIVIAIPWLGAHTTTTGQSGFSIQGNQFSIRVWRLDKKRKLFGLARSSIGELTEANQCRPSRKAPYRPTLLLAMHRRPETQQGGAGSEKRKALCLAYDPDNFRAFCKGLCQHRTLASIIARRSTAVFSCRSVTWDDPDDFGHSTGTSLFPAPIAGRRIPICLLSMLSDHVIRLKQKADEGFEAVYHCKSDAESLKTDDDIVLSTTCFTDVPITFAVIYGCTDRVMQDTTTWLERCEGSALHPLVLPMIFAEHERKRLFNAVDDKSMTTNPRSSRKGFWSWRRESKRITVKKWSSLQRKTKEGSQ